MINRTLVVDDGSYLSVEMQSVYSTDPADWATLKSADICIGTNVFQPIKIYTQCFMNKQ